MAVSAVHRFLVALSAMAVCAMMFLHQHPPARVVVPAGHSHRVAIRVPMPPISPPLPPPPAQSPPGAPPPVLVPLQQPPSPSSSHTPSAIRVVTPPPAATQRGRARPFQRDRALVLRNNPISGGDGTGSSNSSSGSGGESVHSTVDGGAYNVDSSASVAAAHDGAAGVGQAVAPATSQCLHGGELPAGNEMVAAAAYDLLVLILSSQQKQLQPIRRREAVRNSWAWPTAELGAASSALSQRCSVRYVFVVGGSMDGRRRSRGAEGARFLSDDVLMLPVEDGYRQIVQKVLGGLRWAVAQVRFRYVLKCDDDSFICVSRLLELLRPLPREGVYLGALNPHHSVVLRSKRPEYDRWRDPDYVQLFNRTVYAPYMQGAGYVLSADVALKAVTRADALPRLPAVEDALIGTLVEGDAQIFNRPMGFRHKNRDDYAVTVCEADTEVSLLARASLLARHRRACMRERVHACETCVPS